jgi:GNAT superfamily N-acetyltransferase
VELRPTTEDDLPVLHRVFTDAVESLFVPHAFAVPAPSSEVFASIQAHVRVTGESYVAAERDHVVGFGSAWTRGGDWFLASLFVLPAAQGRGVGSALLDAVWGDADRRRTITDSIQPVSNGLYALRGLVPATPILTFAGVPRLDEPAEEAPADLAEIDRAAYGFDRSVDHAQWQRYARLSTWGDAYSYAFSGGAIGPVAGISPPAAARALASELSRAREPVRVRIPGSSRQLVEVALRAGLRLGDVPGLLLHSGGVAPPDALAPSGYMLF